jgi:hypothetical protein
MHNPDELLNEKQAAVVINRQPATLTHWRWKGYGPKYLKVGAGVFYRRSALDEYLKACERDPAAAAEAA